MMCRILLAFTLVAAPASAQYFSAPPAVLVNGSTASAAQVMLDLNRIISDGNSAYAGVNAAIAAFTPLTVPTGMVLPFNLSACPGGWIESNGTSGTVNLQGYFPRIYNTGGGPYDFGHAQNVVQGDSYISHAHDIGGSPVTFLNFFTAHTSNTGGGYVTSIGSASGTSGANSGVYGSETRPVNIALLFCQKT
jgi:hypothetical protein